MFSDVLGPSQSTGLPVLLGIIAIFLVAVFAATAVLDTIRRARNTRADAAVKRRARTHGDTLTLDRGAHAAEVGALLNRLSAPDAGLRPADAVTACGLEHRPLASRAKFRMTCMLQDLAAELGLRVLSDLPLAEVLEVPVGSRSDAERLCATTALEGTRIDFAMLDHGARPVALLTLPRPGLGVRQDPVTMAICAAAGLPLIRPDPDSRASDLRATLELALRQARPQRTDNAPLRSPVPDAAG